MKRTLCVSLMVCWVLALTTPLSLKAAAQSDAAGGETTIYRHEELGFSLNFPASWEGKYEIVEYESDETADREMKGIIIYHAPTIDEMGEGYGFLYEILRTPGTYTDPDMLIQAGGSTILANTDGYCYFFHGSPDVQFNETPGSKTAEEYKEMQNYFQTLIDSFQLNGIQFLTPDDVYAMTPDEITSMRDDLFGKGFAQLRPEEQYNAVMLDYYLGWTDTAVRPRPAYGWERPVVGSGFTPAYYPLNQRVQEDLNGDGIKERITVTASEDGEMNGVVLKINSLKIDCLYSGENLVNGFAIIDIDSGDNYKEVVISDIGPSDDETSRFYTFDGKKIIYMNEGANITRPMSEEAKTWTDMDEIGGLYTYIHNSFNGEITTLQRANLLQTWWYPIRYELTDGHLLRAVPEMFKVHYDAFVLNDMPLYQEQNGTSPTIQMEKGTIVTFTALDDIEWVQVRLPDGQKGWLNINGYENLIINGEEIEAHNVFFHLFQVD